MTNNNQNEIRNLTATIKKEAWNQPQISQLNLNRDTKSGATKSTVEDNVYTKHS